MRVIVTYNSKTGFTKKYAEWIAADLECEAIPVGDLKDVLEYDVIVHGGWIMGGMINGLDDLRKRNPKNIVAFGVGYTKKDGYVETVKETNHVDTIPTFYFVGGINPKKLNFIFRFIVKMVTKEKPKYDDCTDREAIKPLVKFIKSMN